MSRRLALSWLVALVLVVGGLTFGVMQGREPATNAERLDAVAKTIRCPVCSGESISESQTDIARSMRDETARLIREGRTDDQIRAYWESRYGSAAVAVPDAEGIGALVWILPVVASVVAAAGLVVVFRRWRVTADTAPSDDDRALVAAALAGGDRHDG